MKNKRARRSGSFCVMPWVHLHITTNGNVNACCLVDEPFGSINDQSLENIWNGTKINEFRATLLADKKDNRCHRCYTIEEAGGKSLRLRSNRKYMSHFLNVSNREGAVQHKAAPPIYWDIRFSNVCNFRCRSCYHGASSRWFDEAVKLGENVSSKPIIRAIQNLEKFYKQMEAYIDEIQEIYFAGGEPLIMEEHYRILMMIERAGGYDKCIRYNTNFSRFNFNGMNIFYTWSKFKNIYVGASLDALGARGEFLRKEQKWQEVVENRHLMKRICPNVEFSVHTTVSIFNIFHLAEFHKSLVETDFIKIDEFIVGNLLQTPNCYRIQVLPFKAKMIVKEKLEMHIKWITSYVAIYCPENMNMNLTDQFQSCIDFMFGEDLSPLIPEFVKRCKDIDGLRNESTSDIFPELEFLFEFD